MLDDGPLELTLSEAAKDGRCCDDVIFINGHYNKINHIGRRIVVMYCVVLLCCIVYVVLCIVTL